MSKAPLLEVVNLSLWRGELLLLDAINLSLAAGSVLQIQGANGSGKTTLLRLLCGLGEADEGEVRWAGQALYRVRDTFHSELLYLGHKPGVSGALTPIENLRMFCALNATDPARISNALEELALSERESLPCSLLSAGQQRRVALARLVLQPRSVWILDEPLTALDADGLMWVQSQIVAQVERGGRVVFTTHQALPLNGVENSLVTLYQGHVTATEFNSADA